MKYRARIKPREIIVQKERINGRDQYRRQLGMDGEDAPYETTRVYDPDELEILGEVDPKAPTSASKADWKRIEDLAVAEGDMRLPNGKQSAKGSAFLHNIPRAILEIRGEIAAYRVRRKDMADHEKRISNIEERIKDMSPEFHGKLHANLDNHITDIEGGLTDCGARTTKLEQDLEWCKEMIARCWTWLTQEHGTEPPTDEEIEQEFLENYKSVAKSFHEHPAGEIAPCPTDDPQLYIENQAGKAMGKEIDRQLMADADDEKDDGR